jgi:hypothetical protein
MKSSFKETAISAFVLSILSLTYMAYNANG